MSQAGITAPRADFVVDPDDAIVHCFVLQSDLAVNPHADVLD